MRTARPTTRPALAIEESFRNLLHMIRTRFCLFHDRGPANPLVTRERGEAVPFLEHIGIRSESLLYIGRHWVQGASGDLFFGHAPSIRRGDSKEQQNLRIFFSFLP